MLWISSKKSDLIFPPGLFGSGSSSLQLPTSASRWHQDSLKKIVIKSSNWAVSVYPVAASHARTVAVLPSSFSVTCPLRIDAVCGTVLTNNIIFLFPVPCRLNRYLINMATPLSRLIWKVFLGSWLCSVRLIYLALTCCPPAANASWDAGYRRPPCVP